MWFLFSESPAANSRKCFKKRIKQKIEITCRQMNTGTSTILQRNWNTITSNRSQLYQHAAWNSKFRCYCSSISHAFRNILSRKKNKSSYKQSYTMICLTILFVFFFAVVAAILAIMNKCSLPKYCVHTAIDNIPTFVKIQIANMWDNTLSRASKLKAITWIQSHNYLHESDL